MTSPFATLPPSLQAAIRAELARRPAPRANLDHLLSLTALGREVLAGRRRRDPEGKARAAGFDPVRRRELLGASVAGRAILAEEDRRRRAAGR